MKYLKYLNEMKEEGDVIKCKHPDTKKIVRCEIVEFHGYEVSVIELDNLDNQIGDEWTIKKSELENFNEENSNQKQYRKWIEDNIDRLYKEHLDGNEQIADACLMMFGVSLNSKDGQFIEESPEK